MNYFASLSSRDEFALIVVAFALIIIAGCWIWYYGSKPSRKDSIPGRGPGPEHQSRVIDEDYLKQLHE